MLVQFIKDHPVGYKQGAQIDTNFNHAQDLIKKGYCAAAEGEEVLTKEEPEFIPLVLTKKMIKDGVYGELSIGKQPGDVIQVPNPNFQQS